MSVPRADKTKVMVVAKLPPWQPGYRFITPMVAIPYHWGNPFEGKGLSALDAKNRFDLWLAGVAYTNVETRRRAWILRGIKTLTGTTLVCDCNSEACHGYVLARLADDYEESVDESS